MIYSGLLSSISIYILKISFKITKTLCPIKTKKEKKKLNKHNLNNNLVHNCLNNSLSL